MAVPPTSIMAKKTLLFVNIYRPIFTSIYTKIRSDRTVISLIMANMKVRNRNRHTSSTTPIFLPIFSTTIRMKTPYKSLCFHQTVIGYKTDINRSLQKSIHFFITSTVLLLLYGRFVFFLFSMGTEISSIQMTSTCISGTICISFPFFPK